MEMKSRKFLSDIKLFYSELFEMHQFSDIQADLLLHGKTDVSQRSLYIKEVYSCILYTGDEVINTWLTSNLSLSDVACIKGENTHTLKSRKYYLDKMIAEHSNYKDSNILFYVVTAEDISEGEWEELWKRLASIRHKLYPDIIDRKQFFINIPAGEMSTVAPDNFDRFIKMLEIYSVEHRKQVQKQVNEMKAAAGYFNFLNTSTANLDEVDIMYKEKIMNIFGKSEAAEEEKEIKPEIAVPIIKDSNNPWIPSLNKYYDELSQEELAVYNYMKPRHVELYNK